MKRLGLIGYPLSHSFSADYFAQKFQEENIAHYQYANYPLASIEDLGKLLANEPQIVGLNVTIPYKEQVIPFLSGMDDKAKKIGAVNVIKIIDKKLYGYNSDYDGFKKSLLAFIPDITTVKGALILGTGGASKAIATVLQDLNIKHQFISRSANKGLTYSDLEKDPKLIKKYTLIINCTPLGTYPQVEQMPPIPYKELTSSHYLFDLVYNPAVTSFMKAGMEKEANTLNGYNMLLEQAEVAWDIWQHNKPF
ncbi:MAG: shikimate dehydrogenase [Marivirga sp.]|jgi:shikimate dehydrogenase